MNDNAVAIIAALIWLAIAAGVWVLFAWGLSRIFPRLGSESWRGWVPVLNQAEIYHVAGIARWNVVFWFLPFVNLYALYLYVVAAHRINERFGKGVGFTVLAALVPPAWTTVLALAPAPAHDGTTLGDRMENPQFARTGEGAVAVGTGPATRLQSDGPAELGAQAPVGFRAPERAPVPVTPPAPTIPHVAPVVSSPAYAVSQFPPPQQTSLASVLAPSAPEPIAEPAPEPAPAPSPLVPPALTPAPTPAVVPASIPEPAAAIEPAPAAVAPDVAPVKVHNPWAPQADAAPVSEPATRQIEITAPPAAPIQQPAAPAPEPALPSLAFSASTDDDDDDDGETVVVDRTPQITWFLVVDGGARFTLTAPQVLLGRKPTSTAPAIQALAVPDTTRTLSKLHARLDLNDGVWSITDLNSTNGVLMVAADGSEALIAPGIPVEITDRFILGKVGVAVQFEGQGS